jgi:hypothetical protein
VEPEDLETLAFGGQGKRYHNQKRCGKTCNGDLHVFLPAFHLDTITPGDPLQDFEGVLYRSKEHVLPWLSPRNTDLELAKTLLWVDIEHVDDDDYWILELVDK